MKTQRLHAAVAQLLLVACFMSSRLAATYVAGTYLPAMPILRRSEGRVTLEYHVVDGETIKHQLAFSEVIDSDTKRSRISIGHVSHPPKLYWSRGADGLITLDDTGACHGLKSHGHHFVPELEWFLELSYTEDELNKALDVGKQYHIGPSGIVLMLDKYTKYDHTATHRNVMCQVTSAGYDREKAKDILLEVFVPGLKMLNDSKMSLFGLRESVKNARNKDNKRFTATMTIDYFYTEPIDKANKFQMDQLERDLNLPMGHGCSSVVTEMTIPKGTKQSFVMAYLQRLVQDVVTIVYDHNSNYLRRESTGRDLIIWDLNEDLLYHLDPTTPGRYMNRESKEAAVEACSVLGVGVDVNLGEYKAFALPYKQAGSSLDVFEFLGAKVVRLMGVETVNELPCRVFETILPEVPPIFNTQLRAKSDNEDADSDYIVLYYVYTTDIDKGSSAAGGDGNAANLLNDGFWPARISLFQRQKSTMKIWLREQLDVIDFQWGLQGLTAKPSELFMVPDCFDDEDEQLRLNLALEFDQPALDQTKQNNLMKHNKYKLEKDLLDDLSKLLGIGRIHVTEFQLELRPHNVLVNLVISDRIESKRLRYLGEGGLPKPDSYEKNRFSLFALEEFGEREAESVCVLKASHIDQVSVAIFCPRRNDFQGPTCTAVYGIDEPVMKLAERSGSASTSSGDQPAAAANTACRLYRYEPGEAPRPATHDAQAIKAKLSGHNFDFVTDKATFKGQIRDFEVALELQLIIINNYKFSSPQTPAEEAEAKGNIRKFSSIKYDSLGDCTKLCDLDAACKSYSFCHEPGRAKEFNDCVLSSLDLNQNKVETQLISATTNEKMQVIVRDLEADEKRGEEVEYPLDLRSGCNIYEKDFLGAFTQTDEQLRIELEVVKDYLTTANAAECARTVQAQEDEARGNIIAQFAYCASTNKCLMDEVLFGSNYVSGSSSNATLEAGAEVAVQVHHDEEVLCQIYRKRYQMYFHLSLKVLKRIEPSAASKPIEQVELQLSSVEECARACWDTFGHRCLSFDFCTPKSCLLNLIHAGGSQKVSQEGLVRELEFEIRSGCLHYERDLNYDRLRRANLIGQHKPLIPADGGSSSSPLSPASPPPEPEHPRTIPGLVLLFSVAILFVAGLAAGRTLNDRLVGRLSRNALNDSSNSMGPLDSSASLGQPSDAQAGWRFAIDNELYEDSDAIQLEDMTQSCAMEPGPAAEEPGPAAEEPKDEVQGPV